MAVDKAKLVASRLDEEEFEVEGVGTIVIRALSRFEVLQIQKVMGDDKGTAAKERALLAMAMVDPPMSEGDVGKWQKASKAGEIEPVTARVMELSGMMPGADKAAYKEFEASPDAEFRDDAGGEAVHDGDSDATGDDAG
jgi:hypothetical protein